MKPAVATAVTELQAILSADGAKLNVVSESETQIHFSLELRDAACADCVMPREHLVQIFSQRLAQADRGLVHVSVDDPRESPDWVAPH